MHCFGEAATVFPTTTLVSSRALSEAYTAGSPGRLADWPSGFVVRTDCRRYFLHRRTLSTWFWLLTLTVLLSSASVTLETSTDACFPGCTQRSMFHHHKSGSVWRRSMMSWHTSMQYSFWSSFTCLGIIYTQTFRMSKSSLIVVEILLFFMSGWLRIIWTVSRRLPHANSLIGATLTSILLVESLLLLDSYLTASRHLCHSKTCTRDMVLSPYTW